MKYSILKHIKCPTTKHYNFGGEYKFLSFNDLFENMIMKSKWDETQKQDLPLFSCTTFNYNIRADKAKPTMLYALDFDDIGNEIETALEYFKDYGHFIYTSYGHTKTHNKFRVIIKLDVEIANNDESGMVFDILQKRLLEHGLVLDSQCRDISRRFFLPSLNKMGDDPLCYINEGKDVEVADELLIEYERKIIEKSIREQKIALMKLNNMTKPNKPVIGIEKKIIKAQDEFLINTGHQQLGKLIGSLLFWEMDIYEIEQWVIANYSPSSGTAKGECDAWIKWYSRKNITTYSQKY